MPRYSMSRFRGVPTYTPYRSYLRKRSAASKIGRAYRKYRRRRPARRTRRRAVLPKLISNGKLMPVAYSNHTFADVISVSDNSTEIAAYLQYNTNWVDLLNVTPKGVYNTRSSTPGTNDPFSAIRTDPVPRGYDLMTSLYNKARITGAKIEVQYINQVLDNGGTVALCLWNSDNDQSFTIPTTADEVIGTTIPGFRYRSSLAARGPQSAPRLSKSWSQKSMTTGERSDNEYDPSDLLTNPNRNYFNIALVNMFGNTNDLNGRLVVKIHYSIKWSEPNEFDADDTP